ncbi:Trafficking protein particle complex subunit 31 [Tilletia horrida]|nr:Trafficking protein particle complex subunit 31 [Tilletia horrida]
MTSSAFAQASTPLTSAFLSFGTSSPAPSASGAPSGTAPGATSLFSTSSSTPGSQQQQQQQQLIPNVGPDLLDRPRDKSKNAEISASALAFLFSEMISYTQSRSTGIADLESRLSLMGYHVGQRILLLLTHREQTSANPKAPKRETKLLPVLLWIHTNFWKAAFGKAADSLEKSTEHSDEYMISTNVPLFSRSISIPKDMSQLSVEAYTAGMVEAVLDGLGFVRIGLHSKASPWPAPQS